MLLGHLSYFGKYQIKYVHNAKTISTNENTKIVFVFDNAKCNIKELFSSDNQYKHCKHTTLGHCFSPEIMYQVEQE